MQNGRILGQRNSQGDTKCKAWLTIIKALNFNLRMMVSSWRTSGRGLLLYELAV